MDSSMQNMLEMYLFETNTLLEELDGILLEAEKDGSFSMDEVNEIFRIMHTVKGSSAMMQFTSVSTVAHHIENLFYFIRENGGCDEAGRDLFNLLFVASDFLKLQVEKIQNSEPICENADELIEEIETLLTTLKTRFAEGASGEGAAEKQPKKEDSMPEQESVMGSQYSIRVFFDDDVGMENLRAFMLVTALREVCSEFTYEPQGIEDDASTASSIVENGFLLHFDNEADVSIAIPVVEEALNVKTYEILEEQVQVEERAKTDEVIASDVGDEQGSVQETMTTEPSTPPAVENSKGAEPLLKEEELAKKEPTASHLTSGKQNLISVNLTKLDNLMAIVGEIVITESMVTSNPDIQGLKLDNFTKSARQLRKLTDDLQDIVMSIRMVPVSGVFQKMNRIVRDMSHALGKPAQLVMVGADTEVDKTIVDSIGDPIMHMVRNSMDHGLEDSEEDRVKAGKNPVGTITLSAKHTGSEIVISIQDDGKGVDTKKVLQKAKERNLLTRPESEYTQRDILQFLLMPGFSTNDNVTEYSGRGVGMDVVKKNLEKIGGIISMSSEEGEGTTTMLKIPLTLAIVDGMEIAVGDSIFTVPIHNIRQSFKITEQDIVYNAVGGEMIFRMDDFYPILRVSELFHLPSKAKRAEDGVMMWVEASDKSYCLYVDELLGEQQVVVKPLPAYLNTFNIKDSGIAGCTILGNGNISIILDILNLYEIATNDSQEEGRLTWTTETN